MIKFSLLASSLIFITAPVFAGNDCESLRRQLFKASPNEQISIIQQYRSCMESSSKNQIGNRVQVVAGGNMRVIVRKQVSAEEIEAYRAEDVRNREQLREMRRKFELQSRRHAQARARNNLSRHGNSNPFNPPVSRKNEMSDPEEGGNTSNYSCSIQIRGGETYITGCEDSQTTVINNGETVRSSH